MLTVSMRIYSLPGFLCQKMDHWWLLIWALCLKVYLLSAASVNGTTKPLDTAHWQSLFCEIIWSNHIRYFGQFCTTPPNISSVGILLGWPLKTSNVLGSIPTVAVPNPVHPPLLIFLTWLIFCTKNKWTFTSKIYVLGFCWDDDWKSESVV